MAAPDRLTTPEATSITQTISGGGGSGTIDLCHLRWGGQGVFDLPGMITALRVAGWNGPWGVEILSEERFLSVREAARRAADSARQQVG